MTKKKQGHQSVIDPVAEVLGDAMTADRHRELGGPQVPVPRGPGRVGPHQRDNCGGQQEDPPGGLDLQEPIDGACHRSSQEAVAAQPGRTIRRGRHGETPGSVKGLADQASRHSSTHRRPTRTGPPSPHRAWDPPVSRVRQPTVRHQAPPDRRGRRDRPAPSAQVVADRVGPGIEALLGELFAQRDGSFLDLAAGLGR